MCRFLEIVWRFCATVVAYLGWGRYPVTLRKEGEEEGSIIVSKEASQKRKGDPPSQPKLPTCHR